MTYSPLLSVIARFVIPVMLLFAGWLLWKGHNAPGGGFIGGLLTAAAILLGFMASGRGSSSIRSDSFVTVAVIGLGIAALSALIPVLLGYPFFYQTFEHFHLAGLGDVELATALVFDIGVFIVVIGTIVTALAVLTERDD